MMKIFLITYISLLILAGCGITPMTKQELQANLQTQKERIHDRPICCRHYSDVEFMPIDFSSEVELNLTAESSPLFDFGDKVVPHQGLDLREFTSDKILEIVSYSDKRRSFVQLGKLLFLRPNIVFLDEHKSVTKEIDNPTMCFGAKDSGGGIWMRSEVPEGVRYAIIYPSIDDPYQPIDTRSLTTSAADVAGVLGGAIADKIADSRKTYFTDVAVGLEGLIGVEAVDKDARPLGRCRE
jgi:hypothetical protein